MDAESSCPFGRWSEIQGAAFKVRDGPNYGAERKKAPSEFSIYKPVYIEVHKAPRKVFHVARFFDYSVMVDSLEDSGPFPKVLILNVICPLYSPGIWSSVEDGECFLFTVFCKISEEAVKKIEKEQLTPGMKLLNAFFESDPADTQWNNRLKFIARATNVSELSLGPILSGLVSRYNGTPFLLYGNKKEVFVHKKDKEYIEFDIDMNRFNVLARNGFWYLRDILRSIKAEFGIVVEGRTDEELPEQMLTSFSCVGVENVNAKDFPVDEKFF